MIALIAALTGCGGAGSELDTPASTSAGTGTSLATASASTPLNLAVKPVASPSTVSTSVASGDPSASVSGTSIGVPVINGK